MEAVGKRKGFWRRRDSEEDELDVEMEIQQKVDGDYIVLSGPEGEAEHPLKALEELYISEREKPKRTLGDEEEYMDILMAIESTISRYYRDHPNLTDREVIRALEQLNRRPEAIPEDALPTSIQGNLRVQLSLEAYTRHEVRWALRKVLGSVQRHHDLGGMQGYLDFIVDFA